MISADSAIIFFLQETDNRYKTSIIFANEIDTI